MHFQNGDLPAKSDAYIQKIHKHICGLTDKTNIEREISAIGGIHARVCVELVVDKIACGRDEYIPREQTRQAEQ